MLFRRKYVALVLALSSGCSSSTNDSGTVALFDGKSLAGWTPYANPAAGSDPAKLCAVESEAIHCDGSVDGYLATNDEHSDYTLTVEWRWGDRATSGRNSGVLVHATGPDLLWPRSIESQLLEGHAGEIIPIGMTLTLDPLATPAVEKPIGEWNHMEITCREDTVRVVVNGAVTRAASRAEVRRGRILLQSEGAEIWFRRVEISKPK
jgi:Domain of Unknown Function (DUF1080)